MSLRSFNPSACKVPPTLSPFQEVGADDKAVLLPAGFHVDSQ